MKISIVIAAYNESGNIGPLTSRLVSTLTTLSESDWELIYVIDGTDGSREIAETYASDHPQIRILHSAQPSGLANAFRRGFDAVSDDAHATVTLDADLNHQPEEIPRLIAALASRNADIVIGSRKVRGSATTGAPLWKSALSDNVNKVMRRLAGMPVSDMTSGFRVYSRRAFRQISFNSAGFAFLPEILVKAHEQGFRIVEEPIQFIFRVDGESKMRLIPTALSYCKFFAARFLALGKRVVNRVRLALAGSSSH
jgi:dolichol-phosphate mannosyltransferase